MRFLTYFFLCFALASCANTPENRAIWEKINSDIQQTNVNLARQNEQQRLERIEQQKRRTSCTSRVVGNNIYTDCN